MMPSIPTSALDRLAKVFGMLGSEFAGERASAAAAATRLLHDCNWQWADVADAIARADATAPDASTRYNHGNDGAEPNLAEARLLAREALRHPEFLNQWQRDLCNSMRTWDKPVSVKQLRKIREAAEGVGQAVAEQRAGATA